MKTKLCLAIIVCIALAGSIQATNGVPDECEPILPDGDMNRDGYVNMVDIAMFAACWLEQGCGLSKPCNGADTFPYDGEVDYGDLAKIAESWMMCVDATNPACIHEPLSQFEPPSLSHLYGSPSSYNLACDNCPETENPLEPDPRTGLLASRGDSAGVALFSGEFNISKVDMRIRGREMDFVWARTYRSKNGPNTAMGNRWDYSYNIYLKQCGANLLLYDGTGRYDLYYPQGNDTWVADGFARELTQEPDGSFTLTSANNITWTFYAFDDPNAPGEVSAITNCNGATITPVYNSMGEAVKFNDTLNREIIVSRDFNGNIDSVSAEWADLTVSYEYYDVNDANGSLGDLKSVSRQVEPCLWFEEWECATQCHGDADCMKNGPFQVSLIDLNILKAAMDTSYPDPNYDPRADFNHDGYITQDDNDILETWFCHYDVPADCPAESCPVETISYTYTTGFGDEQQNHNILTITDPKGQTYLQNTYSANPKVIKQILGDSDATIDITYAPVTPDANNNYAISKTITNDRMGNVTEHFYDNRNRLVILREYTGRADPNQPTYLDPDVNPPTNKLREDDPNYFETRYQYNIDSLPTRIDYPNGNYTINIYEGDLDPNAHPLARQNLRERHRFAESLAPITDQNEIVEHFEYDPNAGCVCRYNLPTRYVDPSGNETLHDYDDRGNRIRTTYIREAPDTNIVEEWEYDIYGRNTAHILPDNGSGYRRRDEYTYINSPTTPGEGLLKDTIIDANTFALTTTREYDWRGDVTRKVDPNGSDTQYTYDYLGRLVCEISPEVTDVSGVRYQKDFSYDLNGNLIQIDVENIDDQGVTGSNTHFTTTYEYDILNNLIRKTEEVDPNHSVVTEYEYDDNENRVAVRSGEATNGNDPNNIVRTVYDERNLVFKVNRGEGDLNQSTTQYDYDGNGNRAKVHEGLEDEPRVTTYEYDGFDRLIKITDAMGNVTEYGYDAKDNRILTRIAGELGDIAGSTGNVRLYEASYEYDSLNRLIRTEVAFFDPDTQADINDGKVTSEYEYNDNSQITKLTDDNGNEMLYEYDTANRRKCVTDAKGNTVTYGYDENSNVISITEVEKSDLGEPNETFTTTYQYDNLGRRIKTTDNIGNATEYAYDSCSNRTKVVDAKGGETRYEYDGLNRLITTILDPDGDDAGPADPNKASEPDPADGQYNVSTNPTISWTPGENAASHNIYFGADFDEVYNAIDPNVLPGGGNQEPNSFFVGVLHPDTIYYWRIDEVNGSDIWKGDVWSFSTGNEPYKPLNIVTIQSWDDNSRLTSQTDDNGNTTNYEYDPLNRLIKITYADGTNKQTVYDVHNNPVQAIDAAGSVIGYTYDDLNRLIVKTVTPGADVSNETTFEDYQYDGLSRMVRAEDDDSVVTFSYDSVSNVTEEMLNGESTACSYDGVGNKLLCTYPGGRTIDCTYDALNRIKTISDVGGTIATYDYIGLGRVERRDYGNNTRTTYDYDGVQRITQTTHTHDPAGTPTIIDDRTYSWDETYNKTQRKDIRAGGPQLTHDYTYDAVERLIHTTVTDIIPVVVRDTDYDLDGVGNRTTVTGYPDPGAYTMDNTTPEPADEQMNQYTTTSFDSRLYDKNGNLITIDNGLPTQKNVTYDYRNRMVEVNDTNTGQVHTYSYDCFGRRIQKVVDSTGMPQTSRYFYDGWQVVEEKDGGGTTQATYVYGNYIDEVLNMQRNVGLGNTTLRTNFAGLMTINYAQILLGIVLWLHLCIVLLRFSHRRFYLTFIHAILLCLAMLSSPYTNPAIAQIQTLNNGNQDFYYHADDLYNVMAITDEAGNAVERYEYQDYGEPEFYDGAGVPILGTAIGNPYLFTGRRYDPETGLYYYRTRYLEPRSGRFTTRDTIGIWGDTSNLGNAYAYVGNNPVNLVDPAGTICIFCVVAVVATLAVVKVFKAVYDIWEWYAIHPLIVDIP